MRRCTLASAADVGVGVITRVEANISRTTSTKGTHHDNLGLSNVNTSHKIPPSVPPSFMRKGDSGPHNARTRSPPGPRCTTNKAYYLPFPGQDCLRSLTLPLSAFSPSTPSQHDIHSVTFPSETIIRVPYTTQNALRVNLLCSLPALCSAARGRADCTAQPQLSLDAHCRARTGAVLRL